MSPKHKILIEKNIFPSEVLGISSDETIYRIAWLIGNNLNSEMKISDSYLIFDKKNNTEKEFLVFKCQSDSSSYFLVKNRTDFGFLSAKFKNIDYFIVIFSEKPEKSAEKFKKLKENSFVQGIFSLKKDKIFEKLLNFLRNYS